jgi:actin-related protein
MENNRKEDIIIELGAEWIRVGLVGDKAPRKTFRSKSLMKISQEKTFQMEMLIEEFLCNVFFVFLNSTCQGKTVIILEKVYTDRRLL